MYFIPILLTKKKKDEEENCRGTNRREVVQNISRRPVSSVAVAEGERGKWKRRMKQPK